MTYKKIRIGESTIDEHRLIMQNHIGRKLSRYEVVHHKDGNKLNNDISNLEIMSLSDHSRIHMKEFCSDKEKMRERCKKLSETMINKNKDKKYFSLILGKDISKLASQAWPAFPGSVRKYAAHYGIHHKQMLRLINQ